ncbi:hypothetical protein OH687_01130 [Burkholderia anthina]|nr:hypothetical protein OH687_01130 [Burkholderia anthina]
MVVTISFYRRDEPCPGILPRAALSRTAARRVNSPPFARMLPASPPRKPAQAPSSSGQRGIV